MLRCQRWQMVLVWQTHDFVRWIQLATAKAGRWVPCSEGETTLARQSIQLQAKEQVERPCRPSAISWRAIRQTGCTAAGTKKSKAQRLQTLVMPVGESGCQSQWLYLSNYAPRLTAMLGFSGNEANLTKLHPETSQNQGWKFTCNTPSLSAGSGTRTPT